MKSLQTKQGFTLIEVLVSMAVLILLMLGLVRIFSGATNAYETANRTTSRNSDARAGLERIIRDVEGAVVDSSLGMYKVGNAESGPTYADLGFDRLYFVSTEGLPDAGRVYQQVKYYVNAKNTKGYTSFVLMRIIRNFSVYNAFENKLFWENDVGYSPEAYLIENIVRFDIWNCAEDNENLQEGGSANGLAASIYDSSKEINGYPPDKPPAYIDIYLQVTSPEAMKQASLILASGDPQRIAKSHRILYRDSNVLTTRIIPAAWSGERKHPTSYPSY